jgi:cellulose synthase/poly-beta-1,6-N-acetylglucosamine synthase-like glycosyltransferase
LRPRLNQLRQYAPREIALPEVALPEVALPEITLPAGVAQSERGGDPDRDCRPLPPIALVTPSFNQGSFIAATVDSVLAQHYPALDYLVVDGGSGDATTAILARYGARLAWISEADAGQADAINKGFARVAEIGRAHV